MYFYFKDETESSLIILLLYICPHAHFHSPPFRSPFIHITVSGVWESKHYLHVNKHDHEQRLTHRSCLSSFRCIDHRHFPFWLLLRRTSWIPAVYRWTRIQNTSRWVGHRCCAYTHWWSQSCAFFWILIQIQANCQGESELTIDSWSFWMWN